MLPDPKTLHQQHLDRLTDELAEQASSEASAERIRARANRPGSLNTYLSMQAYDAMRDDFADYADTLRDRAKEGRL